MSEVSRATLSADRLERNGELILKGIAAPPAWRGRTLALTGVGAMIVVAMLVVGWRWLRTSPPERLTPPTAPAPHIAPEISYPDALEIEVADAAVADVAPPARPMPHARPIAPPPTPPTPPTPPAPSSDLAEQVRLFENAKTAAHAQDYEQALHLLDELDTRFPQTTLQAEVELSRADYLARAGKVDAAIAATQALVTSPVHIGRRPQLFHVLGDLWIRRGDCAKAVQALDRALSLGLSARDAAAAKTGIAKCSAR